MKQNDMLMLFGGGIALYYLWSTSPQRQAELAAQLAINATNATAQTNINNAQLIANAGINATDDLANIMTAWGG